jgi:2',3'-cyclic-nucleotide 2'-phosphodiesterase (5'-nucleotidase family)
MKVDINEHRVKTALVLLTALVGLEARLYAAADPNETQIHAKILAIGDFHGQLGAGKKVSNRPVGSAAVLASYLKAAQAGYEDRCVIVHCGDQVGASTPAPCRCYRSDHPVP